MNQKKKIQISLLPILGCLLFFLYLFISSQSDLWEHLKWRQEIGQVLEKADQRAKELLGVMEFANRNYQFSVNESMFEHAQHEELTNDQIHINTIEMRVDYTGMREDENEKDTKKVKLEYNIWGEEIGFEIENLRPEVLNLDENQAHVRAFTFLAARGIDTTKVRTAGHNHEIQDSLRRHHFTFYENLALDLQRKIDLELEGSEITQMYLDIEPQKENAGQEESKVNEIIYLVLIILVWVSLLVMVISTFVSRLRRDELDIKRALIVGILVFIIAIIVIGLDAYPKWEGIVFGGLIGGGLIAVFTLLLFAVADSVSRESHPDKVKNYDLLFRGKLWVREIGISLAHGLFWGSLLLVLSALLQWIALKIPMLIYNIDVDNLWALGANLKAINRFAGQLLSFVFIFGILIVFFPAFIAKNIKKSVSAFVLLTAVILLGAIQNQNIEPQLLGMVFFIPVSALLAYTIRKYDLLTTGVAGIIFFILADIKYLLIIPQASLLNMFLVTGVIWLIFAALVIAIIFRGEKAEKFSQYVPEYISRLAERERILQELDIARGVQKRFLPAQVPDFPRLDMAAICRPAMEVGGDYYDFIPFNNSHLSVVIGDVSGKGVSAAFYMTMAKGIIHTLARKTWRPRHIMSELNEVFFANSPREVFISVIWGVFDIVENKLHFARAGHNPLIMHKHSAHEPEFLNPNGLGIGLAHGKVFDDAIEEWDVPIADGDVFVFYTDGISEAMDNQGEEFGEDRLKQVVNKYAKLSANGILEKIKQEISIFTKDAPQHDDFTMVVVKVNG